MTGTDMKNWEKIVILHPLDDKKAALAVNDAKTAAKALLQAWPTRDGKSYRRAVLTCSAAVHDKVPQDTAQWAFIVATMEAGISYEIVDRLDSEIAAVCRELLQEEMHFTPGLSEASGADTTPPFWWPSPRASAPSVR
jgi:hypothetical protein